jgi:hypothetical protein
MDEPTRSAFDTALKVLSDNTLAALLTALNTEIEARRRVRAVFTTQAAQQQLIRRELNRRQEFKLVSEQLPTSEHLDDGTRSPWQKSFTDNASSGSTCYSSTHQLTPSERTLTNDHQDHHHQHHPGR